MLCILALSMSGCGLTNGSRNWWNPFASLATVQEEKTEEDRQPLLEDAEDDYDWMAQAGRGKKRVAKSPPSSAFSAWMTQFEDPRAREIERNVGL